MAKLNATGCRWVAELADFHITIKYRPSRENADADGLSWMPVDIEILMEECTETLSPRLVQATVQSVEKQDSIIWSMALSAQCADISNSGHQPILPGDLHLAQREDKRIGSVIECLMSGTKPTSQQLKSFSGQSKRMMHEWERLILDNDCILRRKTAVKTQLVLPEKYKDSAKSIT